ncbi:hypothetical protein LguiB_004209 [Lonicera macranthoides]
MSSGEVKKVSPKDIQLVQNLIERCLQLYMSQKEVVNTLSKEAMIEPSFTELVWQKLEEENQEFFKAYHLRLILKEQISKFNRLLDRQVELMCQICPPGVASIPTGNGSNMPPMHHNSALYAPEQTGPTLKPENMHHSLGSDPSNPFANGGSSLHPCMPTASDMSLNSRRIDVPPTMLMDHQGSNVGMMQGMNGGMIKSEGGYAGGSPFMYGGGNGNVLEMRTTIAHPPGTSFRNVESNLQPMNEPILDPDTSTYGFLRHIPRNFSLSDLTADFSNSADILETYPRSPFLGTNADNFLDPHGGGGHQGGRLLRHILGPGMLVVVLTFHLEQ